MIGIILISVIVLAAVAIYYFFFRGSSELRAARKDFDTTTKAVGKLMELPDEVPVLATVTDLEKLKGQPFFDEAQNGDKVLVFKTASKVILYRPSTKKIINFSNLNPEQLSVQAELPVQETIVNEPTPSPILQEPTGPVTVTIYNGTSITGLTQKVQQRLQSASSSATVVARGNAAVRDYDNTIVIAITPAGETRVSEIASLLSGGVSTLPTTETSPTTDILIIVGTDAAAP